MLRLVFAGWLYWVLRGVFGITRRLCVNLCTQKLLRLQPQSPLCLDLMWDFLRSCLQMLGPEIDVAALEERIFLLKTQDNAVS